MGALVSRRLSFETIVTGLEGWSTAGMIREVNRNEAAAHLGENRYYSTVQQLSHVAYTFMILSKVESVKQTAYLTFRSRSIAFAAVGVIGIAVSKLDATENYPKLKKSIRLLHTNLGYFLQVVDAVVTAVLLGSGSFVFTSLYLASTAVDFLSVKRIIPRTIQAVYLKTQPVFYVLVSLFSKDRFTQCTGLVELYSLWNNFWAKRSVSAFPIKGQVMTVMQLVTS